MQNTEKIQLLNFRGPVQAGAEVWVVERDDMGYPSDASGFMLLSEIEGFVLVCPFYKNHDDREDLTETLRELAEETSDMDDCSIAVYPAADCYPTSADARGARDREREEWHRE